MYTYVIFVLENVLFIVRMPASTVRVEVVFFVFWVQLFCAYLQKCSALYSFLQYFRRSLSVTHINQYILKSKIK